MPEQHAQSAEVHAYQQHECIEEAQSPHERAASRCHGVHYPVQLCAVDWKAWHFTVAGIAIATFSGCCVTLHMGDGNGLTLYSTAGSLIAEHI